MVMMDHRRSATALMAKYAEEAGREESMLMCSVSNSRFYEEEKEERGEEDEDLHQRITSSSYSALTL